MARFISSKLLALALGAVVLGGGFFATTGTVSADGPDNGGYHDWDNNDNDWDDNEKWDNDNWHDNDWDNRHDDCDDEWWSGDKWDDWNGHGQSWNKNYNGNWNGAGWDKDDWQWYKNKKDRHDCDDDHDRVHVIYIYVGPTSYVHYPFTGPEFGRYSNGLAGLIQDASMVFGITEQALYEKLYTGRTLVDIGIEYKIGEANLRELLLALNPDLAPNIYAIVSQPWLLTSAIWIPQ